MDLAFTATFMWSHCSLLHVAVSLTFEVRFMCPALDAALMQVIETAHHMDLAITATFMWSRSILHIAVSLTFEVQFHVSITGCCIGAGDRDSSPRGPGNHGHHHVGLLTIKSVHRCELSDLSINTQSVMPQFHNSDSWRR